MVLEMASNGVVRERGSQCLTGQVQDLPGFVVLDQFGRYGLTCRSGKFTGQIRGQRVLVEFHREAGLEWKQPSAYRTRSVQS